MEFRNLSILDIIKNQENIKKEEVLKKILLYFETNYELEISIILQQETNLELFYLNEAMEITSIAYNHYNLTINDIEIMKDLSLFNDCYFFEDIEFVYIKTPLMMRNKLLGNLIFKYESLVEFEENKRFLTKNCYEIAFILDYIDLFLINNDAIQNLVESNKNLEDTETIFNIKNKKLELLIDNNYDFGVIEINRGYDIIDANVFIKEILKMKKDLNNFTNYFGQDEFINPKISQFLTKIAQTLSYSVTTINLVSSMGEPFIFKLSANYIPDTETYLLKLYNITTETQITKKYSQLQSKFDILLKHNSDLLINSYDGIIKGTLKFFENKDEDFGNHLERISEYTQILCNYIYENEIFPSIVDKEYTEILPKASVLHDVGMLSIKEEVLFKSSKLTDEEYLMVKKHPLYASSLFDDLLKKFSDSKLIQLAKEIAVGHHERYDGSGYPFKLKGYQIPLSARIVSFADIFDGLTTDRIYKKGLPLDLARMMIVDYQGKQIDPLIVDIFLKLENDFAAIHKKYKI